MADTRTVHVHLAEAPTDVLVHLVGIPHGEHRTAAQVLDAVVPDDVDYLDGAATAARALRLLIDAGYADRRQVNGRTVFWATNAGRLAVAAATASATEVVTASRTDRQPPNTSSNAKGGQGTEPPT